MIIVAELSADYKKECRMLENIPTDSERAEIKDIVGNQYYRLLRRQQDSNALSASKDTITADRGQENSRRLQNQFESNCFNWGKKDRRVGEYRSTKKTRNLRMPPPTKKGEVGTIATFAGVRSTLPTNTVVCTRVLSTRLAIVWSEKQRRPRCWKN